MRAYGSLIAVLCIFAQVPSAGAGSFTPNVVVTTEVLKPLVDAVMEGIGESNALFTGAVDPHTASLTPSQARMLAAADVIIAPDSHYSPGLKRMLKKRKEAGAIMLYLTDSDASAALPYREQNPWLSSDTLKASPAHNPIHADQHGKKETHAHDDAQHHEHTHAHTHSTNQTDPHVWLDPLRMANLMPEIAGAIAEYSPEYRKQLFANAVRISNHLRATVTPALEKIFAQPAPRGDNTTIPFLTSHDAYQYFHARFRIALPGYLTQRPEEYLGAQTIEALMKKAGASRVNCVIAEAPTRLAKRTAELSKAKLVIINPERLYSTKEVQPERWFKNDYDRLLYAVATAFAACR
jgi:zinc transport system substrate-binding protein